MDILSIAIIAFCIMEMMNVIILYFKPDFKYGNGVSVFNGWKKSKEDKNAHLYAKYMARWVAGVKLIFIFLLIVVVIIGSELVKVWAVVAMILSIASYYFALHPIMKKLDKNGEIAPKGYSKTLFLMITAFMLMFSIALLLHFII